MRGEQGGLTPTSNRYFACILLRIKIRMREEDQDLRGEECGG